MSCIELLVSIIHYPLIYVDLISVFLFFSISIQINQESGSVGGGGVNNGFMSTTGGGANNGFIPTGENALMNPQSNMIPNPLINVPHIPTGVYIYMTTLIIS